MRTFERFAAVMLLVAVCDAWILTTEPLLPERPVTKWINGVATNFMTRDQWISAAMGMVSAVGILLACAAALSGRFPRTLRMDAVALTPRAQAWIRERREVALFAVAGLHVLWMTWFHWIILQANRLQPPQLNAAPIAVWAGAQMAVVVLLIAYMFQATVRARRMRD